MSRDARKKQKQRLKREQKRLQAKRARAVTPLDRIAQSGGQLECYVNADWREMGMATLQVLGQTPGGRVAYAAFLVDVWCVGLKDAFGRRESSRADFDGILDVVGREMDMVRLPAARAKQLVAGGIRFARQNGFRLPPHADRWTAIFGDLGDVAAADLTDFGVDGGLRYVGTKAFLQRRHVACTVDQFLARPDVQWLLGDGTPRDPAEGDYSLDLGDEDYDDEENETDSDLDGEDAELLDALKEMVGNTSNQMEDAVRKWCLQTGQAPHPRLRDALNTLVVSTLPLAAYSNAVEEDSTVADDAEVPDPRDLLEAGLVGLPAEDRRSVEEAMEQVNAYMLQFNSPREMLTSLGVHGNGAGPQLPPA